MVTLYQYLFTYQGQYSVSPFFQVPPGNGVCHGDDLIYLWVVKAVGTADVTGLLGNILKSLASQQKFKFLISLQILSPLRRVERR